MLLSDSVGAVIAVRLLLLSDVWPVLSGAVRWCGRGCRVLVSDAVGAVRAVRVLLLSDVGRCCQVLSGGAVGVLSGSDL